MGFFDKFNPFKKNEDAGFNFEAGSGLPHEEPSQNFGIGDHSFEPSNFEAPAPDAHHLGNDLFTPSPTQGTGGPLNDPRMRMPLGESIRQSKYQGEQTERFVQSADGDGKNPLQKDLDLISSKLDYLKASLEAVNQRLVNLEHLVKQEQQNKRW